LGCTFRAIDLLSPDGDHIIRFLEPAMMPTEGRLNVSRPQARFGCGLVR
jgi:hypothetical protein